MLLGINKMIRYSIMGYVVFCTLYSSFISAYSFLVYGPNNYEAHPKHYFWIMSWCIGLPGSLILMLLVMGCIVAFVMMLGNWILFGKFKYFIND